MADKDKRGGASGGAKSAQNKGTGRDDSSFSNKLSKLFSDLESLSKDTAGLRDYGKLLESRTMLAKELDNEKQATRLLEDKFKAAVKEQEEQVTQLKKEAGQAKEHQNWLQEVHNDQFRTWDAKKQIYDAETVQLSNTRAELAACREKLAAVQSEDEERQDKLEDCTRKLKDKQAEITTLTHRYASAEHKVEELNGNLQANRKTLKKMCEKLGIISVQEVQIHESLIKLARTSYELAQAHFHREVKDPRVFDASRRTSPSFHHCIPLILSNSEPAQLMRCAFAEAIICDQLVEHIFTGLYLDDETASRVRMADFTNILAQLGQDHAQEATIIRCQLAKAFYDHGADAVARRAAKEVYQVLQGWLDNDEERCQALRADLAAFFKDATKLWKGMQRTSKTIEVAGTLRGHWLQEDNDRSLYDMVSMTDKHDTQQTVKGDAVAVAYAVLFPRVLIDNVLCYHGHALFAVQAAVVAARQEEISQPSSDLRSQGRLSLRHTKASQRSSLAAASQVGTSSELSFVPSINSAF